MNSQFLYAFIPVFGMRVKKKKKIYQLNQAMKTLLEYRVSLQDSFIANLSWNIWVLLNNATDIYAKLTLTLSIIT